MTSMTMPPDTRPRASLYFARSLHALQAPPRYHRFCSLTLADGSGCLACLLLIAVSGCIDVFDRLEVRGVVRISSSSIFCAAFAHKFVEFVEFAEFVDFVNLIGPIDVCVITTTCHLSAASFHLAA
ncbi:Protein of unknown function [Pyronema omphalodes CBS 100304]|uniref:Uncharacterized protein n=1 Tax=Pyronema omphalodes (strain CBS 100304) TaxID=1076935 RepID=U4LPQ7_PYROM|nr:Protein of unknown function [Pyronema omphalodes CBS 100304]